MLMPFLHVLVLICQHVATCPLNRVSAFLGVNEANVLESSQEKTKRTQISTSFAAGKENKNSKLCDFQYKYPYKC